MEQGAVGAEGAGAVGLEAGAGRGELQHHNNEQEQNNKEEITWRNFFRRI